MTSKEYWKEYYSKTRDKQRERARIRAHLPEVRSRQYQRYYGITVEQYDSLFEKQNGKCAICFQSETRILRGKLTRLCVDHNHDDGTVRGLLCSNCNAGVGRFQDDPERILKAYEYLCKK